jgi:hypothetical protein
MIADQKSKAEPIIRDLHDTTQKLMGGTRASHGKSGGHAHEWPFFHQGKPREPVTSLLQSVPRNLMKQLVHCPGRFFCATIKPPFQK